MFPMFAVARELKRRGHAVRIAAEGHHRDALLPTGIELTATDAGAGGARGAGLFGKLQQGLHLLVQSDIEAEYETVLGLAGDADLIVGNQLAYSGAIVRKVLKKPWVFCVPSPLAIPSYVSPPVFPYLGPAQAMLEARGWPQDGCIALAKGVSRLAMSANVRLQRRLGVFDGTNPRFEGMYSERLNLLLTSRFMAPALPDWPANTVVTGYAWFDPEHFRQEDKIARLRQFIAAGAPPVVFAPGGGLRKSPQAFIQESVRACASLKARAILVVADRFHAEIPQSDDVLVTGYAPYSELLDGAQAFVHSGGIGALGWAARFGVPSLVVPHEWDQFDNARRAERAGIARVLGERAYTGQNVARVLSGMIGDEALGKRTREVMSHIAQESGASVACAEIERVLAA